jgi:hypothetical protein
MKHALGVVLLLTLVACGGGSNNSPTTPSTTPTETTKTFTLSGQVTDSLTGSGISGATVTVADGVNAGKSARTSSSGAYSLANLQQSGFTVNVAAADYLATAKGVTLTADTTLSFQLQPAGPRTRFGAGTYLVGTDIAAGRYFSNPSNGCYWERLSGLGGTLGEILANDFIGFTAAQWIVDIRGSDKAFRADAHCGTWYNTPRAGVQSSITQGVWLVGAQITPGTYRSSVSSGCYWERLRDFTGNLSGIIANEYVSSPGPQLVTISASDVGFSTDNDCGTWTKVSGVLAESVEGSARGDIAANRAKDRARKTALIDLARTR